MKKILKTLFSLALILISVCSCSVNKEEIGGEIDKTQFTTADENGMTRLTKWAEKSEYYDVSFDENTPNYDKNYIVRDSFGYIDYAYVIAAIPCDIDYYHPTAIIEDEKCYKVNGVTFVDYKISYEITDRFSNTTFYQFQIFAELHGHLKDENFGKQYIEKLDLVEGGEIEIRSFSGIKNYTEEEKKLTLESIKEHDKTSYGGKFKKFEC